MTDADAMRALAQQLIDKARELDTQHTERHDA